ncbi:MAG TPA: hypothetical protein VNO43_12115 [Candidatus Eisenbacteria bacterium]|nr:hypothetical protein [Candidatus Eisenbacteria bacterium]
MARCGGPGDAIFSVPPSPVVLQLSAVRARNLVYTAPLLFLACSQPALDPGMTFLVGLGHYQSEMARLESRPERWADRQRLGESLKASYLVTLGESREFNRLVDLDVKRREFLVTMRQLPLSVERVKAMNEELAAMESQIQELKQVVKAQVARLHDGPQDATRQAERVAAIGLVHLALERFSATYPYAPPSAVAIGPYLVTDHGSFAQVATPVGDTYRCVPVLVAGEGAAIECEKSR